MTFPGTILKAWSMQAKKKLGQNFLTDPSTCEMIVSRAGIGSDSTVVEIGSGLGALTIPLAKNAKKVIGIEKDTQLIPLLKNELLSHELTNVEILNNDILKTDLEDFNKDIEDKIIVMGNLPYNISSQVIIKLIESRSFIAKAVFMLQKELAERLVAGPGVKSYGRISAVLQYFAEINTVCEVKSHLFYPKPKVDSEVIELNFKSSHENPVKDELLYIKVVKAAFSKRRKTLKNSLSGSELNMETDKIVKALTESDIDPVRRAETLSVDEFVNLSNTVFELL